MKINYKVQGAVWILLFTLLVLIPLIILFLGPIANGKPALVTLSTSLGFIGLAIVALQFALTARIKPLSKPFGTDLVYYFHRQISIAGFLMIFAHPILLFLSSSAYIGYLNIFRMPWQYKAGVLGIILFIIVVLTAEYRNQLKIPYWFWKFWHGIFATLAISFALIHIFLNGNFVNSPIKQIVWIIYAILWIGILIYTRILYPLHLINNPFKVVEVKSERGACHTLVLKPVKKGLIFHPGQFAWITVGKTPFSDSEHPFSIASSAEHPELIEMTIKQLGKFTLSLKDIKVDQPVYVDGPYGSFTSDRYPNAKGFIFIAGGIGITPIMSVLRTMADRGEKRPLMLLYANRDWETATFREEIEGLKKRLNLELIYVLEEAPLNLYVESGFVTNAILNKYFTGQWKALDPEVFLCGPNPMMNAVEPLIKGIGIPEVKIHSEKFAL